jgi:hypothetical protein
MLVELGHGVSPVRFVDGANDTTGVAVRQAGMLHKNNMPTQKTPERRAVAL